MEYYSAIKMNKILPLVTMRKDLEDIMLSEVSQAKKDKYHAISYSSTKYINSGNIFQYYNEPGTE